MRFVQIKNNEICSVSDKPFEGAIVVPDYLDNISTDQLLINYKVIDNEWKSPNLKKPIKDLKIAIVYNHKQSCGISTYGEALYEHVIPYVKDFCLFIEDAPNVGNIHSLGTHQLKPEQVKICWQRGHQLDQLISEIQRYNPDVIWFQHEFGLWSNARHWLSMMTQLSQYRILVTMHSTFYHQDKTIVEASIPEMVVHIDGAKQVLRDKGISVPIHVIPHGCHPYQNNKLWNYYKTDHSIIQMGFGFKYKNFEHSIKTVSLLKDKYPDVFLTILFSESPFNMKEHQLYYLELMKLIKELNCQNHIAIVRGYQSDQVINSYLKTNKIAIFPYQLQKNHEVWGASGAARLAMSCGLPVISSSIPHFSDLPSIKCDVPEQSAEALDILFSSKIKLKEQLDKQIEWINQTLWSKVAQRHLEILGIS